MPRQPIGTPSTGTVAEPSNVSRVRLMTSPGVIARRALAWALVSVFVSNPPLVLAGNSSNAPPIGAAGMGKAETGSVLVDYYENFLRDHDIETFRQHVSARYTEGTLGRLIASGNLAARRAAVLALGLFGTFESNAIVARALRDNDSTVRDLADNALWAIWFRADTPENNTMLEQVRLLIRHERLTDAVKLATRLIERSSQFAEAFNQRAIAHFFQGHFEESAADCHRALQRNPYHFGALAGLAQCQLRLDQRREALKTFRRALRLQPFSKGLREAVSALESEGE
jgi:tetratricopeptide (TPR) repeat protein